MQLASTTGRRGPAAQSGGETSTEALAAGLLAVARVMTQVRVHERLCRQAGVDLDRLGAALLFKLHTEGDDVRVTELADRLGIDPPAVTRKVQQLERQGYLGRSADPHDARAARLRLSPTGRAAITRLLEARTAWLGELLVGWREADRAEFGRLLGRFADTVAEHREAHHGR